MQGLPVCNGKYRFSAAEKMGKERATVKVTILTVGKLKEKYLRDAVAEYSKRLSRYCKLEILEVADEKVPENAGPAAEEAIRQKEGERLMNIFAATPM